MTTTRADIDAAAARIEGYVRRTPVMKPESGAFGLSGRVAMKLELFQVTGSFKPRGAFHRILSGTVPAAGVITASGGNHGQAVAYAAQRLGLDAEVFVPSGSPPLKAERIRGFGARVRVGGAFYDDAMKACLERAEETGALLVHPYDDDDVVAGQGTVGREIAEQLPDTDTVLVSVGGGGLAAGVAAWFGGDVRVVTVEPERCPALARALDAGAPVEVSVGGIAADSLGAKMIGAAPFEVLRHHTHRAVLVSDDAIAEARARLWEGARVLAEPGGAASLAALVSEAYRPEADERTCVIICGGNTGEIPTVA